MKNFKFNLEPYLKVKKMHEKKKLQELAVIAGEVSHYRQIEQEYFDRSREYARNASQQFKKGSFNAREMMMMSDYFRALKSRKVEAGHKIEKLSEELNKRREAAQKARMARRTVEIIREKRLREHNEEMAREETAFMDEHNAILYSRKRNET